MPRSTLPKNFLLEKVKYNILSYTLKNGGVAQMVERSLSMREVPGSIPGASKLFLWLPIFFVYHFEFDFNEIITQKCDLIYCPQKKIIAGKWENVEKVVYTVCLRKHNIFKVHCLKCQGKVRNFEGASSIFTRSFEYDILYPFLDGLGRVYDCPPPPRNFLFLQFRSRYLLHL